METYDFVDLETKIDDVVIKIVNLFTEGNMIEITLAKLKIKEVLINNIDSYVDYKENIFCIIAVMMSQAVANDCESFCGTFLASTFLLEKFIQYGDNGDNDDSETNDIVADLLGELFFYFQEKGCETKTI